MEWIVCYLVTENSQKGRGRSSIIYAIPSVIKLIHLENSQALGRVYVMCLAHALPQCIPIQSVHLLAAQGFQFSPESAQLATGQAPHHDCIFRPREGSGTSMQQGFLKPLFLILSQWQTDKLHRTLASCLARRRLVHKLDQLLEITTTLAFIVISGEVERLGHT